MTDNQHDPEELWTQGEWYSMSFRQYAAAYGREHPDCAWILNPFDVWMPNPYYEGPPVPHPESDMEYD